jgi:8-oxo-dGTP pyrophosphatase MutT (NUDIX family)
MMNTLNMTSERYSDKDLELLQESLPFQKWYSRLSRFSRYLVEGIEVTDLNRFGSRLGFSKFTARVRDTVSGVYVPGITLLRGDSVAVMVVIRCSDDAVMPRKILLTKQFRTPVGGEVLELVAGMMDDSQQLKGKAIDELREEAGIKLEGKDLFNLTQWAGIKDGIMMSPGLLDERIHLFFTEIEMTRDQILNLQDQEHGVRGEGEVIRLQTINIDDAHKIGDAKLLSAVYLYQNYLQKQKQKCLFDFSMINYHIIVIVVVILFSLILLY